MADDVKPLGCVILADAHHSVLESVRGLLDSMFATVVMVTDQESLMETAKAMSPEMVVLDLSLPRSISGNVIKRVVQEVPGVRILALTMDDDPKVIKQVLASGALAVVVKAMAGTDLIAAIQQVHAGNRYVSPSVPIEIDSTNVT